MNKSLRSEIWQIGLPIILIVVLGLLLFKLSISDILAQSGAVTLLVDKLLPMVLELALLFIFFKIGYYIIITIGLLRFGKQLFGKHKIAKAKRIFNVVWWTLFGLISLLIIVDDPAVVLTSAGLVGLGLTVELQKPIMNFVGWNVIVFRDVYEEGDRIKIGEVRGDVKEIQIFNTTLYGLLDTSDQRSQKIITIPNELVLTTDVENYTQESNYILNELLISVTYESDYTHAMKILERIIRQAISQNIKSYIKKRKEDELRLNRIISSLVRKKEEYDLEKKQKINIKEEIAKLQSLSEEFKPKIRLEMADSAIILVAQFLTPYDAIKRTRTKINKAFLDAISTDNSIEVAYPHMQLVMNDNSKKDQAKRLRAVKTAKKK